VIIASDIRLKLIAVAFTWWEIYCCWRRSSLEYFCWKL